MQQKKDIRDQERDKKRIIKEFDSLKEQLRDKEKGVKEEIEKTLTEWEERCQELQDLNIKLEARSEDLDSTKKK